MITYAELVNDEQEIASARHPPRPAMPDLFDHLAKPATGKSIPATKPAK